MTYVVKLENSALNNIADDCGLVVDNDNKHITEVEIEYFAKAVVRECIFDILSQKPEEGPTKVYNDLAKVLADKFEVTL